MLFRFVVKATIALFMFMISCKYLNAQVSPAEFEEMKQKIETQKIKIESLENRLNTTSSNLEKDTTRYAPMFMVLFLYGAFCANWAQNTRRNPWTWFFLGLFFSVFTLLALLAFDSKRND